MSIESRMQRLMFGVHRQFKDGPVRSARARATALRYRPWEAGRLGRIEKHISRSMVVADRLFTTGELARMIYADLKWDQNYKLPEDPPPKIKSWQYDRVRRAAPTFADCIGRATSRGRPWLWRLRPSPYWAAVRRQKRERRAGGK